MLNFLLAPILYLLAHEGGHFLVALAFGLSPKVTFDKWRIVITFTPKAEWNSRLVMEAGFGVGMILGVALLGLWGTPGAWVDKAFLVCYWGALTLHFWAYPWYNKDRASNDFNGMDADEDATH